MTCDSETTYAAIKALHGKIAYLEVEYYGYKTELNIFLDGERYKVIPFSVELDIRSAR